MKSQVAPLIVKADLKHLTLCLYRGRKWFLIVLWKNGGDRYWLAELFIRGMQWEVSYHFNLWGRISNGETFAKLEAVGLLAAEEVTVA